MKVKLLKDIRSKVRVSYTKKGLDVFFNYSLDDEECKFYNCKTVEQAVSYILRNMWGQRKFNRRYKNPDKRKQHRRDKIEMRRHFIEAMYERAYDELFNKL